MPCDTVTTVTLALRPAIVHIDWLKGTIEQLGNKVVVEENRLVWRTGSYNRRTGELIERTVAAANRIRQNYAAELTRRTLGRGGWQVRTVEQAGG